MNRRATTVTNSVETQGSASTGNSIDEKAERLHVLLAEDSPVNRIVVTRTLAKRGHVVRSVENGADAVTAFEQGHFHVVLMDLQMPIMDGLEATALIRTRDRGGRGRIPIIGITAHGMKGDRERCLAAGMDDYLAKPFKAADLIRSVESRGRQIETTRAAGAQILNHAALLHRVDGDRTLVREIVRLFFEETPLLLRTIQAAFRKGDLTAMGKAAHRLRGTLTTIGAERAAAPALQIELSSFAGEPGPDPGALAELEAELSRLQPELAQLAVN
jgi:CheY-like chemotaxis protein